MSSKDLNRPNPSSKNSHFQNEVKCKTFLVKIRSRSHGSGQIFEHFVYTGTAQRAKKWPINHDNVVFVPVSSIML